MNVVLLPEGARVVVVCPPLPLHLLGQVCGFPLLIRPQGHQIVCGTSDGLYLKFDATGKNSYA